MFIFNVGSRGAQCKLCPVGAVCDGSGEVNPKPGYWMGRTIRESQRNYTCDTIKECSVLKMCESLIMPVYLNDIFIRYKCLYSTDTKPDKSCMVVEVHHLPSMVLL